MNSERLETEIRFGRNFATFALPHQRVRALAPNGLPWSTWLILGGRGAGKTRLGAEWVRSIAVGSRLFARQRELRIALVGETEHDVREVMIEGPAGLLAVSPRSERPVWIPSRRRLVWPSGAIGETFSAEAPEALRGPQFHAAWCDELAKWREPEATFDKLQLGLRLGELPRQLITTTPRPIPLIKRLVADRRAVVTQAPTKANAHFLSPAFLTAVMDCYGGTWLGRQELDGEIIDGRADSLWPRELIERCRVARAPRLEYVVVGVDPPASARRDAAACGIVAAGRGEDGCIYVLADATEAGLSPAGWAGRAIALHHRLNADAIVAEVNMGGDMVRAVIADVDPNVAVICVRATRDKYVRAQPVAAKYEQGKIKHAGRFPELEDEMCAFGPDGLAGGRSPDRLDALVWAVTALASGAGQGPRIRML